MKNLILHCDTTPCDTVRFKKDGELLYIVAVKVDEKVKTFCDIELKLDDVVTLRDYLTAFISESGETPVTRPEDVVWVNPPEAKSAPVDSGLSAQEVKTLIKLETASLEKRLMAALQQSETIESPVDNSGLSRTARKTFCQRMEEAMDRAHGYSASEGDGGVDFESPVVGNRSTFDVVSCT